MADSGDSSAIANSESELLEWPKKDKRRLLHAVYRVGDLDRTIKYAYAHIYVTCSCNTFMLFPDLSDKIISPPPLPGSVLKHWG